MGVSPILFALPIVVMIASIGLQGNTLSGGQSTVTVCNPNVPPKSCLSGGTTSFSCPGVQQLFVVPCGIKNPQTNAQLTCPANPPPPSYCAPVTNNWLLPAGTSVVVNATTVLASSNGVFFGYGTIGSGGFISIIGVIVGLVCLAGITVFNTGQSFEGVHILFMGGALMGLWIFLSGLEGFVVNSKTSLFTELNSSVISMGGAPIGTALYVFLTFMWFVNFIYMVKRGG